MTHHTKLPLWGEKSAEQKLETLREMLDDLYTYTLAEARRKYVAILTKAVPTDSEEGRSIYVMRRMINQYPNIMSPNCEVGHITGSALVVDMSQGTVLLHQHKTLNRWLQFGGHADYETDFAQVALREAQEETGLQDLRFYPDAENLQPIDFDVHSIPANDTRPEHLHLDFRYLLVTNQSHLVNPPDAESKQIIAVKFDALLNPEDPDDDKLLDPALKRLIGKAKTIYDMRGKRQPK
jgi:8-oxo-dGTP pyrophosphatase MutT (NUDIX family)